MPALPPKADIKVRKPMSALCQKQTSLDLLGANIPAGAVHIFAVGVYRIY